MDLALRRIVLKMAQLIAEAEELSEHGDEFAYRRQMEPLCIRLRQMIDLETDIVYLEG